MKKILALSLGIVLMASGIWGATLISLPNTYTTGTKIQASQANANEQHIQTVVNGNMPNGDVVGTTDSQTLTNKTLTTPTLTSPILATAPSITGDTTFSTGVKAIFGNAARYIKDNTSVYAIEFGTHTVIPAASKLYLDGGSDTYISETAANKVGIAIGGTPSFWVESSGNIVILETKSIYLDGSSTGVGGDTYITSSGNNIDFYQGGNVCAEFTTASTYLKFASGTGSDVVYNSSTGQVFYVSSSKKYKENIKPAESLLSNVLKLKVSRYDRKDGSTKNELGLIAEEVYPLFPEIVPLKDGQPDSVSYSRLSVILLKALQEQNVIIKNQQTQIDALVKRIEKLEAK